MLAGLVLLKRAPKSTDVLAELASWIDVFVRISRAPNGLDALSLLLEYISLTSDAEPSNIAEFAKQIGPVAENAYMTAAEKLSSTRGRRKAARKAARKAKPSCCCASWRCGLGICLKGSPNASSKPPTPTSPAGPSASSPPLPSTKSFAA